MRTTAWAIVITVALLGLGTGCETNNGRPGDQAAAAGGNGAFGEGTANPGEHSDQHFRDSMMNSGSNAATSVPATQPSR